MTSSRAPALISRERSILEFNRRVLAQARRKDVPLLERLRYICIVSSNMDEFFEVRFVDALEAARLTDDPDGLASALLKLERVQNGFLRRSFFPGRGLPEPSWLRTHPTTEERVRRLRDLRPERTPGAWGGYSFEPPSFPHVRLRQRPRGGWWGYWY